MRSHLQRRRMDPGLFWIVVLGVLITGALDVISPLLGWLFIGLMTLLGLFGLYARSLERRVQREGVARWGKHRARG